MDFQLHQRVISWLKIAGDSLKDSLTGDLAVEEKTQPNDLVTRMDREIEAYFVHKIETYYPDHKVIGEEGKGHELSDLAGTVWILDPIDGTLNFVKQGRFFGIMIGIYQDGQPLAGYIYDVMHDDLYYGIKGTGVFCNERPIQVREASALSQSLIITSGSILMRNDYHSHQLLTQSLGSRSYGCAAYELIAVIRGEAACYLSKRLMPWDVAAGVVILDLMGYRYSRPNGDPINLLEGGPAVFAHPNVYEEVMTIINQPEN